MYVHYSVPAQSVRRADCCGARRRTAGPQPEPKARLAVGDRALFCVTNEAALYLSPRRIASLKSAPALDPEEAPLAEPAVWRQYGPYQSTDCQ